MAYDKDCWTYWCDKCGCEMRIDHETSTDEILVLRCASRTKKCNYVRRFMCVHTGETNEQGQSDTTT